MPYPAIPGSMIPRRIGAAKANAKKKLAPGPASETKARSLFGFRRLKKFTGTGFAAPKIIGDWTRNKNSGNNIEPNKSKCGKGFIVSRPARRAVWSPNLSATIPWQSSWMTTEKSRISKVMMIEPISIRFTRPKEYNRIKFTALIKYTIFLWFHQIRPAASAKKDTRNLPRVPIPCNPHRGASSRICNGSRLLKAGASKHALNASREYRPAGSKRSRLKVLDPVTTTLEFVTLG